MISAFLAAILSFIITVLSIPQVIKLAKKWGLVDNPGTRPHPAHTHREIIPRAGGLAIYLSIVLTSLIFVPRQKYLIGIILGITVLLVIGLLDDKVKKFNPYLRLMLLFGAAACAVGAGIGISFITNPLTSIPFILPEGTSHILRLDQVIIPIDFYGPHKLILLADIFAFFWIVALTQIINWSKGVDGQMPGITFIASLVMGILSLKFFFQGDLNQLNIAILSFIVSGTSLGFLIFNWFPAKIFPGFSGSTILAFMLAVLAILSGARVATALLVLAVPTADFVYTFCRRILSGKSPVWGDRGHLHHKLLDLGWSHQKISLFYILGSAMLGAAALSFDTEGKIFAGAAVIVAFISFVLWINSFGELSGPPGPDNG